MDMTKPQLLPTMEPGLVGPRQINKAPPGERYMDRSGSGPEGPVPGGAEVRGSGQAVQIQPESPDKKQQGLDA